MSSDLPLARATRHPWYREGEVLILLILVVGAYFWRIDYLSIRGEESRRATIAVEMLRTGDFVVPRQQGEPFLSRPPLGNWLIATTAYFRGKCDAIAIRLPTVSALLFTTVLIYAYGRTFLGRLGALAAAAAHGTMGEVLQLSRFAECDTVFALLLSAALVTWHWGYAGGWPSWKTWCLGYGLAALAALQKGPQAPAYFIGTTVVFLSMRRDWRYLVGWAHGAGILVFLGVLAVWQVPFYRALGWDGVKSVWMSDGAARYHGGHAALVHVMVYPLELIGVTLPWSLLPLAYLSRRFRRSLGSAAPAAAFHAVAFVVGFLPCWLMAGGMTRYMMPLYPSLAVLCGLVVQRALETFWSPRMQTAWIVGRWAVIGGALAVALGVTLTAVMPGSERLVTYRQPWSLALAIVAASCTVITAVVALRRSPSRRRLRLAVCALAAFLALAYSGMVANVLHAQSHDAAYRVACLQERMPLGHKLVSFNGVHHLFAYLYGEPIAIRPIPGQNGYDAGDVDYFCYWSQGELRMPLPFPSEVLEVVPMDRSRGKGAQHVVVVGRRLPAAAASPSP